MTQFASKPLTWFKTNPQVRKLFDEAELRLLGESLKVRQLQPVVAKPDGTLIAGERRFRAAKLAGLATLDVVISEEPLTDSQLRIFQLTENVHRADLTGFEKWQACVELQQLNPQWMAKDLAQHLHLDPSMVTRILSPSKCIVPAQEALAAGKLGISDCYALSKVDEPQQAELLAMKLNGASRDAIEQQGRKRRASTAPAVRLSRVRISLPEVSIVVTGDGISLDEVIDALAEAGKEAKKAREQSLDVKTWENVMRDRAKAKTPE
ncbi:ParB/RepB/Spo0J family partition protein [Limnoglobus roseus]|uniref:ParB-like partition protein n=1 Tax=Limnoglobus roseus TaxID=2598579 RepID=A0A5C1ANI0_9BACT|nr:ParB/RepB/Spo0J family partition protein [Limnoglobus roseus]QEL18774.1 parB-like partition protein [Limnoglobus roseus]